MSENSPYKTFLLVAIVVATLLLMRFMPTPNVAGHEFIPVDILSDVLGSDGNDNGEKKLLAGAGEEPTGKTHKMKAVPDSLNFLSDFSEGGSDGLETFYLALDSIRSLGRPVRIAYYGDSYIEGDILTCDIRETFQDKFGGSGCGWVDLGTTTNSARSTVKQSTKGFDGYAPTTPKSFRADRQGMSLRYFTTKNATTTLRGTDFRKHLDTWDTSLLYLKTSRDITVTATTDGGQKTISVPASDRVQGVKVDGQTSRVTWSISDSDPSACTFYGAVNESAMGVTVDNFAMRGYAGLSFADTPEATLADFNEVRPYDMIIVQYGLNAFASSCGKKWFENYKRTMVKNLEKYKRMFPNTTIVLVSVPDRGSRRGGEIVTMKGLENMIQCQYDIAREAKVVFLNLFETMGGRNSIANLFERKYVGHDYTHISYAGGRYLAKKYYRAVMGRY